MFIRYINIFFIFLLSTNIYCVNIALCFYGLSRSLNHTYQNIQKNIIDPLKKHKLTVFCHALKLNHPYTNPRNDEFQIFLDPNQLYLLKYNYLIEEDQDMVDKTLNLPIYRKLHDPFHNNYSSVNNIVRALYSLNSVSKMVKNSNIKFDIVLYVRHDMLYNSSIEKAIKKFNKKPSALLIPNFHSFGGYNDRFAMGNLKNGLIYGTRFNWLLDYSTKKPVHPETFLKNWLNFKKVPVKKVDFFFKRIRSNGSIVDENFNIKNRGENYE